MRRRKRLPSYIRTTAEEKLHTVEQWVKWSDYSERVIDSPCMLTRHREFPPLGEPVKRGRRFIVTLLNGKQVLVEVCNHCTGKKPRVRVLAKDGELTSWGTSPLPEPVFLD